MAGGGLRGPRVNGPTRNGVETFQGPEGVEDKYVGATQTERRELGRSSGSAVLARDAAAANRCRRTSATISGGGGVGNRAAASPDSDGVRNRAAVSPYLATVVVDVLGGGNERQDGSGVGGGKRSHTVARIGMG